MGHLTEDMTRLCGEIVAWRGARQSFVKDLRRGVAAMKATLRRQHHDMARRNRTERAKAFANLKKTVAGMRQGFAADLQGARRAWQGK
jgi:predicted deacetylase